MTSFPFSQRSQSALSQTNGSSAFSLTASRGAPNTANDPLQPLRAMADRVGKEVEKFAERVDHWHTHGNEDENAKYQTTVSMVGKFRDLAKSTVDELQKQNDRENKGLLDKSVRRRIQDLGPDPTAGNEKAAGRFSQSIIPSIEPSVTSPSSSVQELRHWQEELATWELVRLIIDHYHPDPRIDFSQEEAARAAAKDEEISQFATKKEVWDRFLIVDKGAREKKLILKWLQQTAKNTESDIESIIGQCKSNSGKDTNTWTSGWLDTKAKIKQAKRMQGVDKPLDADHLLKTNDGVSSLVTRLDPDAPARQQQHALAESDEYYENALWMVCYEMLRRGEPWERISDWCKERNEAWRGVSLGAAHDSQPKDAPNMAGNDLGYLFRRMCSYASRETRIPYESAVYALLSGDVDGVQAVCRSWDDHVYTYYNALLLSRFDDILKDRVTPSMLRTFPFAGVTKRFGPWKSTNKHVIDLLMADPASSTLAKAPIKVIQGSLISQSLDELMYRVGVAVADMLQTDDRINNLMLDPDSELEAPQPRMAKEKRLVSAEDFHQTLVKDAHALRILVHVYIALGKGLKVVEADTDAKSLAINNVVTFYIEFLRTTKRLQLIPLYAAQLGKSGGAQCMARVLLDIKNNEEQKRCLNLMKQYDIDYLQAVTENVRLQLSATGFVDSKSFETTDPISRLTLLEKGPVHDSYLWPGVRIQHDIPGCDISAKEEAVVESLMWYDHLEKDINATFRDLYAALETFLLNGRIGAAEKLVTEMSMEAISLTRTTALCGYAFDFTAAGAEVQDREHINDMMNASLRNSGHHTIRPSEIPTWEEHSHYVKHMRQQSHKYFDLCQIVRVIPLLRQWREEEEKLMQLRVEGEQPSMKHAKHLISTLEALFEHIFDPTFNPMKDANMWKVYKAYVPELIIAYLSVLQSGAFYIHRDNVTKAMDIATIVADEEKVWLQQVFMQTGRMKELVSTLARVSKAMLKLGEFGDGKKTKGKRGSKGETLRIWDPNA